MSCSPKPGTAEAQISIPGDVQAFTDTPIYARTSGYLKHWNFDIGTHVRQGQVLAEIETPEIDQQLRSATADLATASANLKLAQITAERNEALLKSRSVSTQERDNAVGTYQADQGHTGLASSRGRTLAAAAFIRKGLCAFRRHHHRT